mmetsp:Transcript_12820/g.32898  ORF Transcript_12820/g.32898 Transcript_12820/m.32898 type:complete len:585 (+) Transcript_12820:292-2046(+)
MSKQQGLLSFADWGAEKQVHLAAGGGGRQHPPQHSRLVTCPVCARLVPLSTMSLHLDSRECAARVSAAAPIALSANGSGGSSHRLAQPAPEVTAAAQHDLFTSSHRGAKGSQAEAGKGDGEQEPASTSGLVACPICGGNVPLSTMSLHLDSRECMARASAAAQRAPNAPGNTSDDSVVVQPARMSTEAVKRDLIGSPGRDAEVSQARADREDGNRDWASPTGLVTCPVCCRHVPGVRINQHLDSAECTAPGAKQRCGAALAAISQKQGSSGKEGRAGSPQRLEQAVGSPGQEQPGAARHGNDWGFLLGRKPVAEYGVHTGLRGGWRPTSAVVDMAGLDTLDAGAEEEAEAASEAAASGASLQPLYYGAVLSPSFNLPGHFVIENFISAEEEDRLLAALDHDTRLPWRHTRFNGHSLVKYYGVESNLAARANKLGRVPMPEWLSFVMERMPQVGLPVLRKFQPNECNAIDYRRALGHSLTPHVDDRQLSGDIICNLSLCGDCIMTYSREKGAAHCVDVRLPRRSLQVQAGGVRYEYQHSISNANLLAERRVSITFRECPLSKAKPQFEGVQYTPMAKRYKWGRKL